MSFNSFANRTSARELADRIATHRAIKDSSPGFHLTDDDLLLCEMALKLASKQPLDN